MFVYEEAILRWAKERNIIQEGTLGGQFRKLLEEAGELGEALATDNREELTDAIGDMAVVLIIMSEIADVSFEGCLAVAYDAIKDRKGQMVNGVFIKETAIEEEERPIFAGT